MMGTFIIIILSVIWLCGWFAVWSDIDKGSGLTKLWRFILLFFIWPYLAFVMSNQGDI